MALVRPAQKGHCGHGVARDGHSPVSEQIRRSDRWLGKHLGRSPLSGGLDGMILLDRAIIVVIGAVA